MVWLSFFALWIFFVSLRRWGFFCYYFILRWDFDDSFCWFYHNWIAYFFCNLTCFWIYFIGCSRCSCSWCTWNFLVWLSFFFIWILLISLRRWDRSYIYFWFCSNCYNFFCWLFCNRCWIIFCHSSCVWIHCVGCSCCFFSFYTHLCSFSVILIFCIIFYITSWEWNWCFFNFWFYSNTNNFLYHFCFLDSWLIFSSCSILFIESVSCPCYNFSF